MKALGRLAATGLVLTLAARPAVAQLGNTPVFFTPNASTGLTIGADYGKGLNNDSGKLDAINFRGELALPMISINAAVGSFDAGTERIINFAGGAGLTLLSLPLTGVSVSAHAAAGFWSKNGTSNINVPFGVTLGIKPPSPGVSFEPWVSVRGEYNRQSAGGFSGGNTNFGASGGVNVGLPGIPVGFHAALDYLHFSSGGVTASPLVFGIGAHYGLTVPGLGVVPGT